MMNLQDLFDFVDRMRQEGADPKLPVRVVVEVDDGAIVDLDHVGHAPACGVRVNVNHESGPCILVSL